MEDTEGKEEDQKGCEQNGTIGFYTSVDVV